LLIALVVMLASYSYVGDGGALGEAAVLIPITAIGAVATNRHHRVIAMALGPVTLAGIVREVSGAKVIPLLAVAGSALLLFAYTTIFVLRRVLQSEHVTGDTLCGAIAVYLMIGLTWSLVCQLNVLIQRFRASLASADSNSHESGIYSPTGRCHAWSRTAL
jgi:hypothetical protein